MPIYRINDKLILFTHIPKCGGTSVHETLRDLGASSFMSSTEKINGIPPQHLHRDAMHKLFPDISMFDYVFSIVRNPFDRIQSEFFYRKGHVQIGKIEKGKSLFLTRNERMPKIFDKWVKEKFKKYLDNPSCDSNHIRPMSDFIMEGNNDIFRLEDGLDEPLNKILRVCGYPAKKNPAPIVNFSTREYFPILESTRQLISVFYEDDLGKFYPDRPGAS